MKDDDSFLSGAASEPMTPDIKGLVERLDFPIDKKFTFVDEPGEHDPCYVVMPDGAMLPLNNHATPGVDIARAHFIIEACNAALTREAEDEETYQIGKRDGYEDAIQDLDLASGGDGEFKGSTIPGETVDVPAMKARILERLSTPPAVPTMKDDVGLDPFGGLGMAMCRETDPPINGEPLMSMEDARRVCSELRSKDLARIADLEKKLADEIRWGDVRERTIKEFLEDKRTAGS